jgi:hypothetical protein
MQTAIVGTSHVAMLKEAIDDHTGPSFWTDDPFFLGVPAPTLSKQNYVGWNRPEGVISLTIDSAINYLHRFYGDAGRYFDPVDHEAIVLVDFFFCYDFAFLFRDRSTDSIAIDRVPVSDTGYVRVLEGQLSRSQYGPSSAVGEVPNNSALPLLAAIRKRAPNASIFLVPRPFQLSANRAALRLNLSRDEITRSAKLLEIAAKRLLDPLGIEFVTRSPDLIDMETGMTPDVYSKGPLSTNLGRLDEHMNCSYGQVILQEVIDRVLERNK